MNRRSLMISTMLMSAVSVGNVWAADIQCLKTPSCEELGYTEVACFQNNGVKCPYGDKYFCICPAIYTYSCTGTGYVGGFGESCNGKYASCACASGYKWKNSSCVEQPWAHCSQCTLGDILFSDGTFSTNIVSDKTPIGVVVYIDGQGHGQVLALQDVDASLWSESYTDISSLINFTSAESASYDFNSCLNTEKLRAQGDSSTYQAAWAAHAYKTEGTEAGDWCLPAAGIFTSYYNNQDAIKAGLNRASGNQLSSNAWSSTENCKDGAWLYYFSSSYGLILTNKRNGYNIRPVLEF